MKTSGFNLVVSALSLLLTSGVSYPQGVSQSGTHLGFGVVYSTPLTDKFQRKADAGFGGSFVWEHRAHLGRGIGSLEYIQYGLPEHGRDENYFQVNTRILAQIDVVRGFGPLIGFVFLGYHNWKRKAPFREKDWLTGENNWYWFPLTFYSLGLGYEHVFSEGTSLGVSLTYTFDLAFTNKSWQVSLFSTFL